MNNWIGLCFLKSHGIFPLSETPWGLCYWKHCQLKLFHLQELPQEWERIYRSCHTPDSEHTSCWELISWCHSVWDWRTMRSPLTTAAKAATAALEQGEINLFSGKGFWWGAVWAGSSSCLGAGAALVSFWALAAPGHTGAPELPNPDSTLPWKQATKIWFIPWDAYGGVAQLSSAFSPPSTQPHYSCSKA